MNFQKKKKWFIFSAIFLCVFVLLNIFVSPIRNVFHFVFSPLERAVWQKGSGFFELFLNVSVGDAIIEENQKLIAENLSLKNKLIKFNALSEENTALKRSLALGLGDEFDLVLAGVLAKELEKDIIFINQGKNHGVLEGMPVITSDRVLAGRVLESSGNFAKVALITAKESIFDIVILNKESSLESLGLCQGQGNFKLGFNKVDFGARIAQGDLLLSSNLSGKFPPGILIGEALSVKNSAAEPFQEGEILPYFKKDKLDYLFVLTNFLEEND